MSRAGGRQDYDFGSMDDEYRGFDPREGEGARGPLILALAGVRAEEGALPVVFADASPYKRVPQEAGGSETPDQALRIYDQLDGSARTEPESVDESGEPVLQGGPPIELRPGEEEDLDTETGVPRAVLSQVEALSDLNNVADAPEEARPVVESAPLPVIEAPAAPTSNLFAFDADGAFLVQIAALRSQDAADSAWLRAVAEFPDVYAGAEKRVQRADLGAKGIFYRLRVGAFETRSKASAFCDELKKRGKTCIVATTG